MSLVSPGSASTGKRPLPAGWRPVRLDGFCRVTHGGTPRKDNPSFWAGKIPWVSPKDMRSTTIEDAQDHISEEAVRDSATNLAPPGSILAVVRSGILARTAPIALASVRVAFNQDIKSIEPDPAKADVWFLYWMLKAYEPVILSDGVKKGATVHSIRSGFLESLEIPLPPLDEQQRIAKLIGVEMAAVKRARAAVEAQLEAAKALPAVYLRLVFACSEAQEWPLRSLGDLCEIQLGKMLSPVSRGGANPLPYLRNANVQWDHLDLSSISKMDFESEELVKFELRPGDLLVCEGGEPGRAAVWDGRISPCYYQKALHRLRVRAEAVIPQFIMYRLWFGSTGEEFGEYHAKTTIAHLPAVRLARLAIRVPSVSQQRRIVEILARQMAGVVHMRRVVEGHLSALETLPTALLQLAFSGAL